MPKKTILFYGAGAINRGFFPWVFPPDQYDYYFVDTNRSLASVITKGYITYRTLSSGGYDELLVEPLKEMPPNPNAVIIAVGPRNALSLTDRFMKTDVPIILAENDSRLPAHFATITGNPNVVFAIPDVITSNGAGPIGRVGRVDIVTESGICYVDEKVSSLGGNAVYLAPDDMKTEYLCKMYLHNTPHCIVAYMGYEKGVQYIHEAMAFPDVEITIMKVMREAIDMLHIMYGVDRARSRAYSDKEVARFSNELLFDPITRVAREPLRKLAQGDRLVGAAALCLQAGVRPDGIFRGIEAACRYTSVLDNDYLTMQYARRMNIHQFLSFIGIRESEPIMQHIKERVASL